LSSYRKFNPHCQSMNVLIGSMAIITGARN